MSRGVMVWATRSDLLRVLQRVERRAPLCYRLCGAFDSQDVPSWESASEIAALGVAREGKWNSEDCYLVLSQNVPFTLRSVRLGGGARYFVDQLENPESVTLWSGGLYRKQCLIMGEFGTVSPARAGFDLFGAIRRAVRTEFQKVRDAYVGPEAYELGKHGVRLTDFAASPREDDLPLR